MDHVFVIGYCNVLWVWMARGPCLEFALGSG